MTTLTIRFNGLQEQILDRLVKAGVAETKSEAVRMSLVNFASELGILDDEAVVSFIRNEVSKAKRTPEEILSQLERVKNETITR